tara:strand:+ start:521 stop:1228 length:708 start_codon:yes stop_codon:yes gene_type:complete
MKIFKNICKSLLVAICFLVIFILAKSIMPDRIIVVERMNWALNLISFFVFSIVLSFIFFHFNKDSIKKISGIFLLGTAIYLPISYFLISTESPWEKIKISSSWGPFDSPSPKYISKAGNKNLIFAVIWQRDPLGGYFYKLVIDNSSCSWIGSDKITKSSYKMGLNGEKLITIRVTKIDDHIIVLKSKDFKKITNWKARGKKVLKIVDDCNNLHKINITGYRNQTVGLYRREYIVD